VLDLGHRPLLALHYLFARHHVEGSAAVVEKRFCQL
jgi:hypothetical protein